MAQEGSADAAMTDKDAESNQANGDGANGEAVANGAEESAGEHTRAVQNEGHEGKSEGNGHGQEDEDEEEEEEDDEEYEGDVSNSMPLDPSKVKVEPMDDSDGEGNGSGDEWEEQPYDTKLVKAEVRDHRGYEYDDGEEEEEEVVDPEDHEAVWEQDDDPDFDVGQVVRKRRAGRSRRVKSYYDDDEYDDDDWEYAKPRRGRKPGSATRRKKDIKPGESVQCEKCQKMWPSLPSLLKHISHIKPCRLHYGQDRIYDMRVEQRKARYRAKDPAKAERDRQQRMKNYHDNRLERLAKSREYYQRNKDRITLRKRLSYKDDPEGQSSRSIRVGFNEPENPMGVVNWTKGVEETDLGMCEFGFNEDCTSKLDVNNMPPDEVCCLPDSYSLVGRLVHSRELDGAQGFVGLTLGEDKSTIEARPLLARSNINISDMRELFHSLMAVTGASMKDILEDKGSSISVISHSRNLMTLRNRYSKEITASNNQMPEMPKPICFPGISRETQFLAPGMDDEIPGDQILVNYDLAPNDMGAIALECRIEDGNTISNKLIPLFTVNMEDWRLTTRFLFTVLINWVGTKNLLEDMWLSTPCGTQGERMLHHELKEECYQNCIKPKTVSVCEHCGKTFVYNAFIQSEKAKYEKHVAIHDTTCKICGKVFPNMPAKRNHQRTHSENHFPCNAKKGCKYVGRTQEMLDKHIQYFHTRIICELCGKDYTNKNSLSLHISLTHNKKVCPNLVCSFCGKVGFHHEYELKRHEKRHIKPGSNVNKWMENKGTGFVCPLNHENCKKYFKKASYVRKHIRLFAHEDPNWEGRSLPENLRKKGGKKKQKGEKSGSPKKTVVPVQPLPGMEAAMAAAGVPSGYLLPHALMEHSQSHHEGGNRGSSYKQEPYEGYERA